MNVFITVCVCLLFHQLSISKHISVSINFIFFKIRNTYFPRIFDLRGFSSSMYVLSILKLKSLYVAKTNVRACCLVNSDAPNRGCCAKCIVQSALSTWRRRSTMSVSIPGTNSRQPLCICVSARSFLLFSCRLCSQLQFVLPFHRVYHNKRNVAN